MTNLLWPGDQRAGELMTDQALLQAMVVVESGWLHALADAGLAPSDCASADLHALIGARDCESLAATAEDAGNPVVGLVALLRARADFPVSRWIHRGLTSQDVLDTALMLTTRDTARHLKTLLAEQISRLCSLIEAHRRTPMVARTLTQHAVPTTFGAKSAAWLGGVADAYQRLAALRTPVQIGGAAGTLAASTELAALAGMNDPPRTSLALLGDVATRLGLEPALPWHVTRTPMTDAADAFVGCTDAWGHIATDVAMLARPEIGELSEPTAGDRGRSSSMPQKRNPILSVLIRRAAIAAPPLAATLHTAAALTHDERADGAWHTEWDTLRTLARRAVVAGSQCTELVGGLEIHPAQMARNLNDSDVLAEQRAVAELVEKAPSSGYDGATDLLIDDALHRAARLLRDRT